ncbi:MAG: Fe-S cluster assembly protein SufD [Frankiaceae bacterium]|jgi:Fe-S cluster assembly protein SufD|nr:Fe-S cluster assembly protein SufD [Frankiaceae bacterium]MDX6275511.1 Fe-S cluster assembly protein SufD [Frankiales bacterium]
MAEQNSPGGVTAGSIAVHERGVPLAGPGTGRKTPDARPPAIESRDVDDFAPVAGREEDWRFTPVKAIRGLLDGTAIADGDISIAWDAPDGVTITRVGADDKRIGSAALPADRAAAVALAKSEGALLISIPADLVVDKAITVSVKGSGGTAYGHLVIDVAHGARATVVLDHAGSGTFSAGVEAVVGDSAHLTLISLQDWEDGSTHLGQHSALVGRDASFKAAHVTLGGSVVRLTPRVRYSGPGGDAELLGLYFADEGQHLEHRTLIDHQAAHCKSRVTYKGALQGKSARTVWIGDVVIGAEAIGTDTYELNRNLLLSDGARADSVPNLEILTGEVIGAGHASTTGRFDDDQLFYLQSRGIPADDARRMVVRAFFAEVIQKIGLPDLEERLLAAVDAELAGASA